MRENFHWLSLIKHLTWINKLVLLHYLFPQNKRSNQHQQEKRKRKHTNQDLWYHSVLFSTSWWSSSASIYLFQNQCGFHTLSLTSSMATPFVSGIKNKANSPITLIQALKKKNIPDLIPQSIDKKACAITNVNNMLHETATANPALRVSRGNVSLGISHPKGPHDHANPIT